jgi:hypothetical protein
MVANEGFMMDAHSAASVRGIPGVRVVLETVPCEASVESQIEKGMLEVMDKIIAELIRPLTEEEKSPKKEERRPTSRLIFKGSLGEVNRFFYQRGWTDGLPIIPPTEEAVAEMLTGTDLPPDHEVTRILPRLGKATVEKIAINAVMAGVLPTYMPLLITAVQVLTDRKTRSDMLGVSTGSFIAFWIVNGPIRNILHINCGTGAMSPGDMANSAIGRAMTLIIRNIGGMRKGIEDMGVLGNPSKYGLVIGEYEEESPWEPLHVERGFNKEDSTLTLFYVMTINQAMASGTDAEGILKALANGAGMGMSCIVLIPGHAKLLVSEGWTKQKVKEYILKNASAPSFPGASTSGGKGTTTPPPPRPAPDPELLRLAVAGGTGAFMGILRCVGGIGFGNSFVTKKIELPANWDKLVEKYKNITPTYARY